MNLKETLKSMIVSLSPFVPAVEEEVQLAKTKLEDGVTVIEADSFESGKSVFIITESGESIPMPIGTYQLEDGSILEVVEEGIIDSVTPADAPVEEEEVEEEVEAAEEEEVVEEEVVVEEETVDVVTREEFDALVGLVEEMKSSMNLSKETIEIKDAEIDTLKVELSNEPAAKKINNSPEDLNSNNQMDSTSKKTKLDGILFNIKN